MVEQLMKNIYRIEVPLPQNPLRAINSYIIRGQKRNLIIDTGMNLDECYAALYQGLAELEIDLSRTDFFITHLHADHLGLISRFATESSRIFLSEVDSGIFSDFIEGKRWHEQGDFALRCGFPKKEVEEAIAMHPGFRFRATGELALTHFYEGDWLETDDYRFQVIETPGHTPGHLCLYEPEHRILISGDHILGKITLNISSWSGEEEPLSEYLQSLDKITELEVDRVLPGHRHVFSNCRERIQELKDHHERRLQEIFQILSKGALRAYDVAAHMSWDMSYKTWEEFPASQKWFATGEAISHLLYLEVRGQVRRETNPDGQMKFSL